MGKLDGKVAVITGGNSGIGLATARRFVEEGAYVVITGRREKELKEAAALIGRNVTTVVGDVTRACRRRSTGHRASSAPRSFRCP